ncbi:MAG TPA: hypothetical protein VHI76_08040 [Solirubrobacterales bacterium]|jgi:hypothetical protein|nr:hypothetical protein [Solirubrobacterales bacterium]
MAKVWVLDTETKGTGAEMVPLDKVLERKRRAPKRRERASRPRRRAAHESGRGDDRDEADRPRGPRRYRVVSALTGRVIADGVGLRDTVEHVRRGRSVADVRVYVWAPQAEEWRALSLEEQRLLRGVQA